MPLLALPESERETSSVLAAEPFLPFHFIFSASSDMSYALPFLYKIRLIFSMKDRLYGIVKICPAVIRFGSGPTVFLLAS